MVFAACSWAVLLWTHLPLPQWLTQILSIPLKISRMSPILQSWLRVSGVNSFIHVGLDLKIPPFLDLLFSSRGKADLPSLPSSSSLPPSNFSIRITNFKKVLLILQSSTLQDYTFSTMFLLSPRMFSIQQTRLSTI